MANVGEEENDREDMISNVIEFENGNLVPNVPALEHIIEELRDAHPKGTKFSDARLGWVLSLAFTHLPGRGDLLAKIEETGVFEKYPAVAMDDLRYVAACEPHPGQYTIGVHVVHLLKLLEATTVDDQDLVERALLKVLENVFLGETNQNDRHALRERVSGALGVLLPHLMTTFGGEVVTKWLKTDLLDGLEHWTVIIDEGAEVDIEAAIDAALDPYPIGGPSMWKLGARRKNPSAFPSPSSHKRKKEEEEGDEEGNWPEDRGAKRAKRDE